MDLFKLTPQQIEDLENDMDLGIQGSEVTPFNFTPSYMPNENYRVNPLDAIINPMGNLAPINPMMQPKPQPVQPITQPKVPPKSEQPSTTMASVVKKEEDAPEQTEDEMVKALQDRQKNLSLLAILQGAHKVGASIAGTQADTNYTKPLQDLAMLPVEDIKTKRASEKEKMSLDFERGKNDSKSEVSAIARDVVKSTLNKIGYSALADKIGENISAKQLEDRFGEMNIQNLLSQYETSQMRLMAARERAKTAEERSEDKKDAERKEFMYKASESLQKKPEYKSLLAVNEAVDNLQSSLDQATASGDIAAIYKFMKGLDADSAVREAEIELARSGQGALANIRTKLTQMGSNPRILTAKYVQQMKQYMEAIKGAAEKRYRRVADGMLKQAEDRGIPKDKMMLIDNTLLDQPAPQQDINFDKNKALEELKRRSGK